MSVVWERFAGRTDVFAVRLSFIEDPDVGVGATPEESASWGALQIWSAGQNLCAHTDQGEILNGAHWYLLSFLEWVAANWNPLLHEEKLPNRNAAADAVTALELTKNAPSLVGEAEAVRWESEWFEWRSRHAVRAVRDGGLLPNVVIRRSLDLIEVSWHEESIEGSSVGFQFNSASGVSLLDPVDVANPLYDVIDSASAYLVTRDPSSTRLARLRDLVSLIPAPQRNDRLGWLTGLRTGLSTQLLDRAAADDTQRMWNQVLSILSEAVASERDRDAAAAALATDETRLVVTGSCHAALLFSAVSPSITDVDVRTLAGLLLDQYVGDDEALRALQEVSPAVPIDPRAAAWEQGYDLAEDLHDQLATGGPFVDIEAILAELGVFRREVSLTDRTIRGCSLVGPRHRPTVALNRSSRFFESPTATRFTLAHELCHLLYDRSHGVKLAIASGPWAPKAVEQRANAFAAMFLMPPFLVQEAIADAPDPITDIEGVGEVAERLNVGLQTAVNHLFNLTLMTEEDRDTLLRSGEWGRRR